MVDPRPDTLGGSTWTDLVGRLADARRLADGVALPGEPEPVTVRARLATAADGEAPLDSRCRRRSSSATRAGVVTTLPLGRIGTVPSDLAVDLPVG